MDIVYNECLILLEDVVFSMSGCPLQQFGLPSLSREQEVIIVNCEYLRELSYDIIQFSDDMRQLLIRKFQI